MSEPCKNSVLYKHRLPCTCDTCCAKKIQYHCSNECRCSCHRERCSCECDDYNDRCPCKCHEPCNCVCECLWSEVSGWSTTHQPYTPSDSVDDSDPDDVSPPGGISFPQLQWREARPPPSHPSSPSDNSHHERQLPDIVCCPPPSTPPPEQIEHYALDHFLSVQSDFADITLHSFISQNMSQTEIICAMKQVTRCAQCDCLTKLAPKHPTFQLCECRCHSQLLDLTKALAIHLNI